MDLDGGGRGVSGRVWDKASTTSAIAENVIDYLSRVGRWGREVKSCNGSAHPRATAYIPLGIEHKRGLALTLSVAVQLAL